MRTLACRSLVLVVASLACAAQAQFLTPTANLVIENIPPIPEALVKKVAAYTEFKASSIIAWHPKNGSILIRKRLKNSNQLHLVASAGDTPVALTDFADAVNSATFHPSGDYLLFQRANGGDEVFRIYRLDLASKAVTAISPEGERASAPAWNAAGDRIVFTTATIDRKGTPAADGGARSAATKVYIADPLKPDSAKVIASYDGGGFFDFRFSPDGKKLLYQEYVSAAESHLWLLDIATDKLTRISPDPKPGAPVAYGAARFSKDGSTIYTTSDRGSEFRHLVTINLTNRKETILTGHLKHDVDSFNTSYQAKRIAFVTNEDGSSVLRFLDLETGKELPRPALLSGEISAVRWKGGGDDGEAETGSTDTAEIAFTLTSARSAGEVFSMSLPTPRLMRWTNGASPDLNPLDFVEPKIVRWNSFDGLAISGFAYQPDAKKFPGKRPVIINIHGGPEGQARPGFIARSNYMVNELGICIIFPNVRGSSGFGKTFLSLDNGKLREDSVKDIGALFDWIKTQPDLDANKVLVTGGSYGGYMVLAVSTHYPDRIVGAVDVVGISNFVTFLTNTESYRRDLRRVEYGDERIPDMRQFLEKISPLNNAAKIKKPLFVVQGKNDPRVPYTEAVQMVAQLKKQQTPVWFLMANDEGHGFAKKSNQDFLFYSQIKFVEKTLLN